MGFPPKVYQFLVGTFAALGSFLYGYDLTIVAEVVSSGSFLSYFSPTTTEIGLVASLLTAGAFVGAGLAYPCSDYFGRRATILAGGLIFCLGGSLQAGARNYGYILGGRFIAGVSIGVLTMIVPIYQAELVHPNIRGLVTGLQQFMLGIGGVCGSWISYGTYVGFADNRQWRIPLGIQIVPAALLSGLIFLFPESPRWLISQGQLEKGLLTLARLHANGNTSDPWILAEYEQIKAQVAAEKEHSQVKFYQWITDKSNFRRLLLASAMQAATQMTGVSAIQYYSVTIFKQIGIDGTDTLRYQAINSIIGLLGEFLLMIVVDKMGRRKIVVGGNLAMCLTYVISTILLAQFPPETNNAGAHWGFIIMTWIYNFCFSCSMGPLSWMIPAEIFDMATRAKGVAIGCMVSFAFNTMIGQVTPIGMANSGWRFYILFVVCNFANAIFFWAMLPETKQLPLEEMKKLFTESPWFIGNSTKSQNRATETSILAERIKHEGLEDKNGMTEQMEITGQLKMRSRTLAPFAFELLPLGFVQPRGWIRDQLKLCAAGLGGNLYKFHRFVKDTTWLGGDAEYSPLRESAPYWYNYIVPLAYVLDDDELKKQANEFLDRTLKNQHADGWIGPEHTKYGRGLWARCLVMMGMVNHALADPSQYDRIVDSLLRFTRLVNSMLKDNYQGLIPHPGDEFDEFCITRAHELSTSLQWLYEQVSNRRDKEMIWETMDLAWEATRAGDRDWSKFFTEEQFPKKPAELGSTLIKHVVNVSEALRYMPQLYRMTHDPELIAKSRQSVDMSFKYHGTTFGALAGDEFLAGVHPKRGAELCGTVELIFSLSYMYRLFGDNSYADRAELATFNGLPAGMTPDWWAHNYLTQSNEPWARNLENWPFYNCGGRALVYGLEPNYPCCLVNHSQAMPKFAMNAFVASADLRSISHQFLVPAEVSIPVKGEKPIHVVSETHYPFDERITYKIETSRPFNFYIRVPEWATKGTTVNTTLETDEVKEEAVEVDANSLYKIAISPGKTAFRITLNAEIRVVPRANNAVAIYRGALLYAMEIPHKAKVSPLTHFAEWKPLPAANYPSKLRDVEYTPTADWQVAIDPSQMHFHRSEVKDLPNPIFESGAPPVSITVAGTKISNWKLEGDCAGIPPADPSPTGKPFAVKLVPFASAKLHISEFPVVNLRKVELESQRSGHCILM